MPREALVRQRWGGQDLSTLPGQAGLRVGLPSPLGLMWQLRTAVWVAPHMTGAHSQQIFIKHLPHAENTGVIWGGSDQGRPSSGLVGFPF